MEKIRYGNPNDIIIETIITDGTGRNIDKWKCMHRDYPSVLKILNKKYGFNMNIKTTFIPDTDLDWAM